MKRIYIFLFAALFLCCMISQALGADPRPLAKGQTIYVPAYSHIYHGNKETPILLSVTLSIRNIDPHHSLTITSVNYHETAGALVKKYILAPLVLGPLGSERFIVPQRDNTGGSGANFIVQWNAEEVINPPIIETVMIGTQSPLGISFTSRGQAIE